MARTTLLHYQKEKMAKNGEFGSKSGNFMTKTWNFR